MTSQSAFAPDLFVGKTALVTGGGTGLGKAIARQLSSLGANVVIAARRAEILEAAAVEISDHTGNPVAVDLVDIKNRETVEGLAERHTVDILVNNAGGAISTEVTRLQPERLEERDRPEPERHLFDESGVC